MSYQIGGLRLPSHDFTAPDHRRIIFLRHIFLVVSQLWRTELVLFWSPTEEDWLVALEAVDSDKIRWAIEDFGSFKSTGEDGIFPALLKNGIEILYRPLVKIFTVCLALGYMPEAC
jgi:hypothetical protein